MTTRSTIILFRIIRFAKTWQYPNIYIVFIARDPSLSIPLLRVNLGFRCFKFGGIKR